MTERRKQSILLNLAGDKLPAQLLSVWGPSTQVKTPATLGSEHPTMIAVADYAHPYSQLDALYNTVENNIPLINVSPVSNVKDFLLANGRTLLDPYWMQNTIGSSIIQRLFNTEGSIHLDDAFGTTLSDYKVQKISSHLRSGLYADIIATEAYANDFESVGIRGFIYDIIAYVAYLKQLGVATFPLDMEYAHGANGLVIEMHAAVKDFSIEYILDCFGEENSHEPFQYLLGHAHRVCPFVSIQHVQNASRLVITGVWPKNSQLSRIEFHSLLIHSLDSLKQIQRQVDEELAVAQHVFLAADRPSEKEISAVEERGALHGNMTTATVHPESSFFAKEPTAAEALANKMANEWARVSGKTPTQDDLTRLLGQIDPNGDMARLTDHDREQLLQRLQNPHLASVVDIQRIQGLPVTEEERQTFSSKKIDLERDRQYILGQKEVIQDETHHISGRVDEDTSIVRIKGGAPTVREGGLHNDVHRITGGDATSTKGEFQVRVTGGGAAHQETPMFGSNLRETALLKKAVEAEARAEKLQRELDAAKLKIVSSSSTQQNINDVQINSSKAATDRHSAIQSEVESQSQYKTIVSDSARPALADGIRQANLVQDQKDALIRVLEKEKTLTDRAKQIEIELKKKQIEFDTKDQLLRKELGEQEQRIKAKDLAIEKIKEAVKVSMDSKQKQVNDLNNQVLRLSESLRAETSASNPMRVRELENENMKMKAQLDTMRERLSVASEKATAIHSPAVEVVNKTDLNSASEMRVLTKENTALKAQVDSMKQKLSILSQKIDEAKNTEVKVRENTATSTRIDSATEEELNKSKLEIKTLQAKLQLLQSIQSNKEAPPSDGEVRLNELEDSLRESQTERTQLKMNLRKSEIEIKGLQGQLQGLQTYISKLEQKQDNPDAVKVAQLESDIRAMTIENKNHVVNLKQADEKARRLDARVAELNDQIKKLSKPADTTELQSVKQETVALRARLQEAENKFAAADKQMKSMTKRVEETEQKYKAALEQAKKAQQSAHSGDSEGDAKSKHKIQGLETANNKLKTELTQAQTQAADQKKEATKLKAENTGLKNKIQALEKEIQKTKVGPKKAA